MADPTVMLIDDDQQFIYLMQRYAQVGGFAFTSVSSIDEVDDMIGAARQQQPTIIFLAVSGHFYSRCAALRALHADVATRTIPIVLFSAIEIDPLQCDEVADVFLLKPIMYDDFVQALASVGVSMPERALRAL